MDDVEISDTGKSSDNSLVPPFREINNTGLDLGEMEDYPGVMAVLVEALEKKGVRFNEASFGHGDITHENKHVVIFRGAAAEFLHRAFEGIPSSVPGE